jgi:hypothetical protein
LDPGFPTFFVEKREICTEIGTHEILMTIAHPLFCSHETQKPSKMWVAGKRGVFEWLLNSFDFLLTKFTKQKIP